MGDIAVSFFSEPHAGSRTRRVSFPRAARQDLHRAICRAMQGPEFFCLLPEPRRRCCYTRPPGDHNPRLSALSPGNQA